MRCMVKAVTGSQHHFHISCECYAEYHTVEEVFNHRCYRLIFPAASGKY